MNALAISRIADKTFTGENNRYQEREEYDHFN